MTTSSAEDFVLEVDALLAKVEAASGFEDWLGLVEMTHDLEKTRLKLDVPPTVAKSPAMLLIWVRKDEVPPFCDDATAAMLARFPKDASWMAMFSSDPFAQEASFSIAPIVRQSGDGELERLMDYPKAAAKALAGLRSWRNFIAERTV